MGVGFTKIFHKPYWKFTSTASFMEVATDVVANLFLLVYGPEFLVTKLELQSAEAFAKSAAGIIEEVATSTFVEAREMANEIIVDTANQIAKESGEIAKKAFQEQWSKLRLGFDDVLKSNPLLEEFDFISLKEGETEVERIERFKEMYKDMQTFAKDPRSFMEKMFMKHASKEVQEAWNSMTAEIKSQFNDIVGKTFTSAITEQTKSILGPVLSRLGIDVDTISPEAINKYFIDILYTGGSSLIDNLILGGDIMDAVTTGLEAEAERLIARGKNAILNYLKDTDFYKTYVTAIEQAWKYGKLSLKTITTTLESLQRINEKYKEFAEKGLKEMVLEHSTDILSQVLNGQISANEIDIPHQIPVLASTYNDFLHSGAFPEMPNTIFSSYAEEMISVFKKLRVYFQSHDINTINLGKTLNELMYGRSRTPFFSEEEVKVLTDWEENGIPLAQLVHNFIQSSVDFSKFNDSQWKTSYNYIYDMFLSPEDAITYRQRLTEIQQRIDTDLVNFSDIFSQNKEDQQVVQANNAFKSYLSRSIDFKAEFQNGKSILDGIYEHVTGLFHIIKQNLHAKALDTELNDILANFYNDINNAKDMDKIFADEINNGHNRKWYEQPEYIQEYKDYTHSTFEDPSVNTHTWQNSSEWLKAIVADPRYNINAAQTVIILDYLKELDIIYGSLASLDFNTLLQLDPNNPLYPQELKDSLDKQEEKKQTADSINQKITQVKIDASNIEELINRINNKIKQNDLTDLFELNTQLHGDLINWFDHFNSLPTEQRIALSHQQEMTILPLFEQLYAEMRGVYSGQNPSLIYSFFRSYYNDDQKFHNDIEKNSNLLNSIGLEISKYLGDLYYSSDILHQKISQLLQQYNLTQEELKGLMSKYNDWHFFLSEETLSKILFDPIKNTTSITNNLLKAKTPSGSTFENDIATLISLKDELNRLINRYGDTKDLLPAYRNFLSAFEKFNEDFKDYIEIPPFDVSVFTNAIKDHLKVDAQWDDLVQMSVMELDFYMQTNSHWMTYLLGQDGYNNLKQWLHDHTNTDFANEDLYRILQKAFFDAKTNIVQYIQQEFLDETGQLKNEYYREAYNRATAFLNQIENIANTPLENNQQAYISLNEDLVNLFNHGNSQFPEYQYPNDSAPIPGVNPSDPSTNPTNPSNNPNNPSVHTYVTMNPNNENVPQADQSSGQPNRSTNRPATDNQPLSEMMRSKITDLSTRFVTELQNGINANGILKRESGIAFKNIHVKSSNSNSIGQRQLLFSVRELKQSVPRLHSLYSHYIYALDSFVRVSVNASGLPVTIPIPIDQLKAFEDQQADVFNQLSAAIDKAEENDYDNDGRGDGNPDCDEQLGLENLGEYSYNDDLFNVDLSKPIPPIDDTLPLVFNGAAIRTFMTLVKNLEQFLNGPNASLNHMCRMIIRVAENAKILSHHLKSASERIAARLTTEENMHYIIKLMVKINDRWMLMIDAFDTYFRKIINLYGLHQAYESSEEGVPDIANAGQSAAGLTAKTGNKSSDSPGAAPGTAGYSDSGLSGYQRSDDLVPKSARAQFFQAGRDTVAQSKDEAIMQELMFNAFSFVPENGYLGSNKIHLDNKRNNRIRYEAPLALPRQHELNWGVVNEPKSLQDMIPSSFMSAFFKKGGKKINGIARALKKKRQNSTALIDDVNLQSSSRGLYWLKPSPYHFNVQTEFRPIPTKDPAGFLLDSSLKDRNNTWWHPYNPQPERKKFKPKQAQRYQRMTKMYDSMM